MSLFPPSLLCTEHPLHHLRMITVDIHRFSVHLAAIYANLAKPVLDVILYNYQLAQNVGAEGLFVLTVFVQASAALCMPSISLYLNVADMSTQYEFLHHPLANTRLRRLS